MNPKGKLPKKSKSTASKLLGSVSSKVRSADKVYPLDLSMLPLDTLTVKIFSLKLTDENPYKSFSIRVCFMDQIVCSAVIESISALDEESDSYIAKGSMSVDPSDQDKMCLMADYPMTVHVLPLLKKKSATPVKSGDLVDNDEFINIKKSELKNISERELAGISCCNIDILPLFTEKDRMLVRKRLEPMIKRSVLFTKSWCNLPQLYMEVSLKMDHSNEPYHRLYHRCNHMTVTLVGAYNLGMPSHEDLNYVAASKIACGNYKNSTIITFDQGQEPPKGFSSTEFYPHWESLRSSDEVFTKNDEKWRCGNGLEDIQNDSNIDLDHYVNQAPANSTVSWASFHRALMPADSEAWLRDHVRGWRWPLELHASNEERGCDYMAFVDLFKLLYPGVQSVCAAVPLQWLSISEMMEACACAPLLPTNDRTYDRASSGMKSSRRTEDTDRSSTEESVSQTGADGNAAFVIIEVKLARPLVDVQIPPMFPYSEIDDMLTKIENTDIKRKFTGRGQLNRDWQRMILSAVAALRKVPYHGADDVTLFMRQLAESRTRVEVFTSFWQEAAIYVNNNFVVKQFLQTEKEYEELLTAAFGSLMRVTSAALYGAEPPPAAEPALRAARHARHMHDLDQAKSLFLYLVTKNPYNADYWREFGNAMKHFKRNWSRICIDRSIFLNPRHPLTLIAKGCFIDGDDSEIFFKAVLEMYPFWYTGWVIISSYYWKREMYHMAEALMMKIKEVEREQMLQEVKIARAWEHELGDWWDHTPILPGMSPFYDAADLLLRIRALTLAQVCVARALLDSGPRAQYYHQLALCCRLRGNAKDALCHLNEAIKKFGEISYLRTLQGECYHLTKESNAAMASFEKVGNCAGPYSVLLAMPCRELQRARTFLVDLVRRHPCAYTWMALADDWMMRSSKETTDPDSKTQDKVTGKSCAAACAIQALKWDRLCARAWALLSQIVPVPTRRVFYAEMALKCGYVWKRKEIAMQHDLLNRPEHPCHRVATALMECRCKLCNDVRMSFQV